jgi:hypothetical protein
MAAERPLPRSRRSLLATAAGGLAALVAGALGRPADARAAAGDYLVIGEPNSAGPAQTSLSTYALGASFTLQTTNESTGATGIFGWASSPGPNRTRGVYGRSDSPAGYAVEGNNNAASHGTGAAVHALGGQNHGLDATTNNAASHAVQAVHAGSGIAIKGLGQTGVQGVSNAAGGAGVHGRATTGALYGVLGEGGYNGVWGETNLTGAQGVVGVASAISGPSSGVYGSSASTTGKGVRGQASADTGTNYGVYGETNSPTGFGGYFDGRVFTTKFYELLEIADPAAPSANRARLFARDNGVGKTQLCVLFPTGAVQVLATEP